MSEQEKPAEPVEVPVVEGATPDEPLGEGGKKALIAEREAKAAAEKRASELEARVKEFENRDKTDQEKADAALAEARAELTKLTVAKTRAEVANTKGVPADLVAGPASDSPEDIAKFADALIAFKGEPIMPSAAPFIDDTNKVTPDTDFNAAIHAATQSRNWPLVATLKSQQAALNQKG